MIAMVTFMFGSLAKLVKMIVAVHASRSMVTRGVSGSNAVPM